MADMALPAGSALLRPLQISSPRIRVVSCDTRSIVHVAAFRGRADDLSEAVAAAHGVALPRRPSFVVGGPLTFIWAGHDAWLAMTNGDPHRDLLGELSAIFAGAAALTDQTDARALFSVSGPAARDCLAKGFAIDLHPRSFKPGVAAITHAAHVGAAIWQLDHAPSYEIAVARSYAESFADWLAEAAAEFAAA